MVYLLCVLPVLIRHAAELPALLLQIVRSAFSPRAAGGALWGNAIWLGVASAAMASGVFEMVTVRIFFVSLPSVAVTT